MLTQELKISILIVFSYNRASLSGNDLNKAKKALDLHLIVDVTNKE